NRINPRTKPEMSSCVPEAGECTIITPSKSSALVSSLVISSNNSSVTPYNLIMYGTSTVRSGHPNFSSTIAVAPLSVQGVQYSTAVSAYRCATRTRSSISTHSLTVCCPPARGPCVIAGTPFMPQKLLPSSTNGFGPVCGG